MLKKSLLTKEYKAKVNEGGKRELFAHNTYKQFANCMEGIGYFGAAAFFKKESEDELSHYQLWADFANDRGDVLEIPSIEAPSKPGSLKEAFDLYYELEKDLGEFYGEWYVECEDPTISQRLLFFVETQRTSVGEAGDYLATLNVCGDDKGALLLFDKELNG